VTETIPPAYQSSLVKRKRSTRAEMEARLDALYDIVAEQQPMTVRQVFYQATVRGLIPKTENGYQMVGTALSQMRLSGRLPFAWIADNTRLMRKPTTFRSLESAIRSTAHFYRKALWTDESASYVEIWLEKDALSGVIYPVTSEFDVPLMVARGYASLSFLHGSAEQMAEQDKPCYVYQFGDHDPSGVDAARAIEVRLRELAPDAEIHFERIAVIPEQIDYFGLPSRPTKTTDTRSKKWTGGDSVELDAIAPGELRSMVRECIERHIDVDALAVALVAEESERDALRMFSQSLTNAKSSGHAYASMPIPGRA
jgi:hypothetical protein